MRTAIACLLCLSGCSGDSGGHPFQINEPGFPPDSQRCHFDGGPTAHCSDAALEWIAAHKPDAGDAE